MKIIFTFSIPREFYRFYLPLSQSRYGVSYIENVTTSLELPDEAAQIPNASERVLSIAKGVGELTQASLSVTCTPLSIKDFVIKDVSSKTLEEVEERELAGLFSSYMETIVLFNYKPHETITRQLRIAAPIRSLLPEMGHRMKMTKRGRLAEDKRPLSFKQSLRRPDLAKVSQYDQPRREYYERLIPLAENVIPLLNANPHLNDWTFLGIHPFWYNEVQHKQAIKRTQLAERKAQQEVAKRSKLEAKHQAHAEKTTAQQQISSDVLEPKHGAGRTIGARPGIYNGVQMRSQLEIRVACELDDRKIRWIYEAEVLGDAGYLIDFYLPDFGIWIEVKGRTEARDRQVLPQVAHTLKHERKQRLFMYTSSGPCLAINPSGFLEIPRKNFWTELFK